MSAPLGCLLAVALSATAAIVLERNEQRHPAFYALKPLTTILILAAAALTPGGDDYQRIVLLALAFSLAGDICLMFAGDAWFVGGLGSFLLAHLAFIAAFAHGLGPLRFPAWLALIVPYAAALLWLLVPRAGKLKLPVLVYCVVLGAMVCVAAARQAQLGTPSAALALAGALVFMLSDSALGVRQFVRAYRYAQPLILSTYWLAIGLVAASV